ncbi:MAG: hypothetical protein LC624_08665 [Halobacteriales archaeon]|nr:hypothetical protein [Halobacteriales archaeon]
MAALRLPVLVASALLLPLASPLAGATITSGDMGDETGIDWNEPGIIHFNCGIYGPYAQPRVDLSVLGGADLLPDSTFYSYFFIVPILCQVVGLNVDQELPY